MRARFLGSRTCLALQSWTTLSLALPAQAADEGEQSRELRWGAKIRAFEEADQILIL
jgi:hypothetical protein